MGLVHTQAKGIIRGRNGVGGGRKQGSQESPYLSAMGSKVTGVTQLLGRTARCH